MPTFHVFTSANGPCTGIPPLVVLGNGANNGSPAVDRMVLPFERSRDPDKGISGGSIGLKGDKPTEMVEELEAEIRNGSLHSRAIIAEAVSKGFPSCHGPSAKA